MPDNPIQFGTSGWRGIIADNRRLGLGSAFGGMGTEIRDAVNLEFSVGS